MVNKIKPVPYVLMVGGLSQTEHNWIQEDFVTQAGTWSIETSGSVMKFYLMDVGEAKPSVHIENIWITVPTGHR